MPISPEILMQCWLARLHGHQNPTDPSLKAGLIDQWTYDYAEKILDALWALWPLTQTLHKYYPSQIDAKILFEAGMKDAFWERLPIAGKTPKAVKDYLCQLENSSLAEIIKNSQQYSKKDSLLADRLTHFLQSVVDLSEHLNHAKRCSF